jgi:hypothetical protein
LELGRHVGGISDRSKPLSRLAEIAAQISIEEGPPLAELDADEILGRYERIAGERVDEDGVLVRQRT